MNIKRRDFIKLSAGAAGVALITPACSSKTQDSLKSSDFISKLRPMTGDIVPITDEE
ncbi:unnamed protein product, partial [marine sediment metagenome]